LDRSGVDLELVRLASLLDSDPAAAARQATQLLRANPGYPPALLLLANAHRRAGNPAAALEDFAKLAATQPASAVIRLELARALLAAGQGEAALKELQESVRLAPDLAEGWRELSLLQAARNAPTECDAAYARFEKLVPEERQLLEASAAVANERYAAAEMLLQRALARSPRDVIALRLQARVATARDDYPQAERLLQECLRIAPGYSRARLDLVGVFHLQLMGEPMLPLLERLRASEPDKLIYRSLTATAYTLLGHIGPALEIHQQLLRELPEDHLLWLNYGTTLRDAGRPREAIEAYRRCVVLQPACGTAWLALADLKTYRFAAAEIAAMETELRDERLRSDERARLEFALGKAREDAGEFEPAFQHYAQGNALRHATLGYDNQIFTRYVEATRALCTPEFVAARHSWGSPSAEPIFIVGLPRSGSTLIEQILASHSQVEGTRELPLVIRFTQELGAHGGQAGELPYPRSLQRLTRTELTALGERYLQETRTYRQQGRPHFIDKMGSNFQHLALIHLMLPQARIIDARRSALGCCFSNFKQHFGGGAWFSYSLEDLGRHYRDYVDLMAHFDAVLPGRILRIHYEELVADLAGEVRRLLEFCGLPFEEQCLRFHETQRAVATASSEQVRKPIYADSLEQWRNFEPWLGPLKEALGELR
jgi:predicted Zn-dependent protease